MAKDFGFVIMPFRDKFVEVFDYAIKPALESQKLDCIKGDQTEKVGRIVKHIVDYITRAKVIIADLTDLNPNVFYELGIAHSLQNNVIMLAQDIDKDVPFDLGEYRVIRYTMDFKGATLLKKEIEDTIKDMNSWEAKANNPVQEFLCPVGKPLAITEYKKELEILREEQIRLKGINDFSLEFFKQIGFEGPDMVEKMKQLLIDLETAEDVTVPVQRDSDSNDGKRKRITFKKINL